MRKIAIRRNVDAKAEAIWPHITEPELMNAWSRAKIRLLAPGDGGGADCVGAVREVAIRLPTGRTSKLIEAIEESEPPHRYVYRVVDAPLFRAHRGTITVADGELRWDVEFRLASDVLSFAAEKAITTQLEQSLDALASIVARAPARPIAPCRRFADDPPTPELFDEAESILQAQRALAERLARANDPKQWFSRVYVFVTEAQLRAVREHRVKHSRWVLSLIPRFHHYYVSNLRRWMGEEHGLAEAQWRHAFASMEGRNPRPKDARYTTFYGLKQGIVAHIEEDLPRALAEVYARDYAGRCDFARFRCDFLLMGGIFEESSFRLLELVPKRWVPWYVRMLGSHLPEITDGVRRRRFYDVRRARRLAFDRGERIAAMIK